MMWLRVASNQLLNLQGQVYVKKVSFIPLQNRSLAQRWVGLKGSGGSLAFPGEGRRGHDQGHLKASEVLFQEALGTRFPSVLAWVTVNTWSLSHAFPPPIKYDISFASKEF